MNLNGLITLIQKPYYMIKMRRNIRERFKLRSIDEVVKKYEEIKFKLLESERSKNGKEKYYSYCVSLMAWLLNDNKKDK